MNKYLFFLPAVALIFLCAACSSFNSPEKIVKLNTAEQSELIIAAKNTLLKMPNYKVSNTDKRYIKKNPPHFRVRYTGNKKGKYTIRWEIPSGLTLQVFGKGDLLDFKDSFEKISIVSIKVNNSKN